MAQRERKWHRERVREREREREREKEASGATKHVVTHRMIWSTLSSTSPSLNNTDPFGLSSSISGRVTTVVVFAPLCCSCIVVAVHFRETQCTSATADNSRAMSVPDD